MKAQRLATAFSLAATLAACTDPQTPASSPDAAPTVTTSPTSISAPTATATTTSVTTAAPTAPTTAAPDSPDKLAGPYKLTYLQTGGIAGLHMELVIDTVTRKASYAGLRNNQPQTKDITAEEVAPLTRALEAARYATFHGPIKGTTFPDAFAYALTLEVGGKKHDVSWTDGTTLPDALGELRTVLAKLRDAKFPAKGTAPSGPNK